MRALRIILGIVDCCVLLMGSLMLASGLTSVGCLLLSNANSMNAMCRFGFDNPSDALSALIASPLVICALIHGVRVAFGPATESLRKLMRRLAFLWAGVMFLVLCSFAVRAVISMWI
jgi:hypothetical protein